MLAVNLAVACLLVGCQILDLLGRWIGTALKAFATSTFIDR